MILEESFQLMGGVERVMQYHLRTELQDGIKRRDVLRRVGRDDGYAVTWPHAESLQARGRCANLAV